MIQGKKFNNRGKKLRILVAPLDWGLGHATRCIPIINELMERHCEVILAGNENTFSLLKKEFPNTLILPVFGYKILYGRSNNLFFKLLLQLPKVAVTILKEYNWLKKIIVQYRPDVVISDNRFGMYNPKIVSIYITHQLTIKTGHSLTDKLTKFIHNQFIIKYDQCWIPDFKGTGLAGELSHPKKIPRNAVYIGALSRFEKLAVQDNVYDLLISLSGPEPQRTIFEKIILRELEHFEKKVLVVRGLPTESQKIHFENSSVTFANHLSATDLNLAFQQSEMIICRSGYTTIMDLVKIGKKAILVPTPGQREQEYLASYLMEKKNFLSVQQKKFKLKEALSSAAGFPFVNRSDNMDTFKRIITDLILPLKSEGTFAAPQAPFPK